MTEEYYREQYRKYLKEYETLKAQHLIAKNDPGAWSYRAFKKNVQIAFSQSQQQIEKDNITEKNVYKVIASKQRALSDRQYRAYRPAMRHWFSIYRDPDKREKAGITEAEWDKIKQFFETEDPNQKEWSSMIGYARRAEEIAKIMYLKGRDNFYNYINYTD